jgi:hypothetical protein
VTSEQERKHYRLALKKLIATVEAYVSHMDVLMKQPFTTDERGRRIAKAINELEFANDIAKRFGIGTPDHHRKQATKAQKGRRSA